MVLHFGRYLAGPRTRAGCSCGAAGLLLLQPRDAAGACKACIFPTMFICFQMADFVDYYDVHSQEYLSMRATKQMYEHIQQGYAWQSSKTTIIHVM
jgi:hypothetical protein